MSAALNRLGNNYYNSQPKTVANPGGMDDGGQVINFPLALADVAAVAGEVAANAGQVATALAAAAESLDQALAAADALHQQHLAAGAAQVNAQLEAATALLNNAIQTTGQALADLNTAAVLIQGGPVSSVVGKTGVVLEPTTAEAVAGVRGDVVMTPRRTWDMVSRYAGPSLVAFGAIAAGQTVARRADGAVEAVRDAGVAEAIGTRAAMPFNFLSPYVFRDATSGKIVVAGLGIVSGSYVMRAVAGAVNDTAFTWGAPVAVGAAPSSRCAATMVDGKLVMVWADGNTGYLKMAVAAIAGTALNFGAEADITSEYIQGVIAISPMGAGRVLVTYGKTGSSFYAKVVAIAGTAVTAVGAEYSNGLVTTSSINDLQVAYDEASGKAVVAHASNGSTYARAVVVSRSNMDLSFGAVQDVSQVQEVYAAFITSIGAGVFLIGYSVVSPSQATYLRLLTISGTTLTFGSAYTLSSSAYFGFSLRGAAWDAERQQYALSYSDLSTGYGKLIYVTINGATITGGASLTYRSTNASPAAVTYDPGSHGYVLIDGNQNDARAQVVRPVLVLTNAANYAGVAAAAAGDGAHVRLVNPGQVLTSAGLTPGTDYYVTPTGGLQASTTGYPRVGRAITPTQLVVEGYVR